MNTLSISKYLVPPRFKSRQLLDKFRLVYDLDNSEVFKLIRAVTKKDIILDYIQLRIGLLHYLNIMLPENARIATSSYTIFDMINIIINSGKKPIFVDIDKRNLGPDLKKLIELVINKKVDCVIYTYLHGYKYDITNLAKACKENNCLLVEDCAQSLWSIEDDKSPGSFGDAALFSTGLFKNVNTLSGGLLCIKSENKLSNNLIRSHSKLQNKFTKEFFKRLIYAIFFKLITNKILFSFITFPLLKLGYKNKFEFINKRAREENNPKYIHRDKKDLIRMNSLQKFLLSMKTKQSIKDDYSKKLIISEYYLKNLKTLIDSKLIYIPGLEPFIEPEEFYKISSNNQIPLICSKREELLEFLIINDIDIAAQHIRNLTDLDIYKDYIDQYSEVAHEISQKIILLPCYPNYPKYHVKKITNLINQFYLNNYKYEI